MSDRSRSSTFGDSDALLYDISPKLVWQAVEWDWVTGQLADW